MQHYLIQYRKENNKPESSKIFESIVTDHIGVYEYQKPQNTNYVEHTEFDHSFINSFYIKKDEPQCFVIIKTDKEIDINLLQSELTMINMDTVLVKLYGIHTRVDELEHKIKIINKNMLNTRKRLTCTDRHVDPIKVAGKRYSQYIHYNKRWDLYKDYSSQIELHLIECIIELEELKETGNG